MVLSKSYSDLVEVAQISQIIGDERAIIYQFLCVFSPRGCEVVQE